MNTYQIQDNWSYVHGKSQWKAGVNFTRQVSPNIFLPNFNGSYDYAAFTNNAATNVVTPDCTVAPGGFLDPLSAFACNIPTTIGITQGSPKLDFKENDTFLYVQNDYKLRPNLTLNLGLTWSYYGPVSYTHLDVYKRQALSRAVGHRRCQRAAIDKKQTAPAQFRHQCGH